MRVLFRSTVLRAANHGYVVLLGHAENRLIIRGRLCTLVHGIAFATLEGEVTLREDEHVHAWMSTDVLDVSDPVWVLNLRHKRHRTVVALCKLDEAAEIVVCRARRRADATIALGPEICGIRGGFDIVHRMHLMQYHALRTRFQLAAHMD